MAREGIFPDVKLEKIAELPGATAPGTELHKVGHMGHMWPYAEQVQRTIFFFCYTFLCTISVHKKIQRTRNFLRALGRM